MANDSTQLLVPGTAFRMLTAPYAASGTPLPADALAYGGAWPAPWSVFGYSDTGIAFAAGRTLQDITVDQELDPVVILGTARDIHLGTALAQFTETNLQTAVGYGTTSGVAAGAPSAYGHDDLVIQGGAIPLNNILVAAEAQAQDGTPWRVILFRCNAHAAVNMTIKKNEKTNIPFEARALPDTAVSPSQIALIRKVRPQGT